MNYRVGRTKNSVNSLVHMNLHIRHVNCFAWSQNKCIIRGQMINMISIRLNWQIRLANYVLILWQIGTCISIKRFKCSDSNICRFNIAWLECYTEVQFSFLRGNDFTIINVEVRVETHVEVKRANLKFFSIS